MALFPYTLLEKKKRETGRFETATAFHLKQL